MKIFAIRDDNDTAKKDLGYLIYYEQGKKFYVELPDRADYWETPLLLASYVKRGERTVNADDSKLWVQQRIVPQDRQNIGQILKENGLKEYDEFALLMLAKGRCAQDEYYLTPVSEHELPEDIRKRHQMRVEDVVPLKEFSLLVFFHDGAIKKCDMRALLKGSISFQAILKNEQFFQNVKIQVGGYGISWGDHLLVADHILYENGMDIALTLDDFKSFVSKRVVNSAQAAELLGCSRQNINDLVKRDKLHPIKADAKNTLFLESEILKRNWN